jgi:hypothetical protein
LVQVENNDAPGKTIISTSLEEVVVDKKPLCPWFLKAADVLARYPTAAARFDAQAEVGKPSPYRHLWPSEMNRKIGPGGATMLEQMKGIL